MDTGNFWIPRTNDRFVVDVQENIGYLVHENGDVFSFPVVTGQRRTVHYIGLTYFAATPERQWTVRTHENKGKSVTFGPSGRFLRLFLDDGERTAYGIHGHMSAEEMLSEEKRYRSMGCIIVSEPILDIVARTLDANGGTLRVITTRKAETALLPTEKTAFTAARK